MERALDAENSAADGGLLQQLDARVKVAGLFSLILAAALAARLWVIAAVFALAVVLAVLSRVPLRVLATGHGSARWRLPALSPCRPFPHARRSHYTACPASIGPSPRKG